MAHIPSSWLRPSLALLSAAAFLGFSATASAQECASDSECDSGFECIKGWSSPGCSNPPDCPPQEPVEDAAGWCERAPVSCSSDSDCPDYLRCADSGSGVCTATPGEEPVCEEPDPADKVCAFEQISCSSASDCPQNFACETFDYTPPCAAIDCAEGEPDCDPGCGGETVTESACVPAQITCSASSDCPSDWTCQSVDLDCGDGPSTGGGSGGGTAEPQPAPAPEGREPSRNAAGVSADCTGEVEKSVCVPAHLEGVSRSDGADLFAEEGATTNGSPTGSGAQGSGSGSSDSTDDSSCAVSPGSSGQGGLALLFAAVLGAGATRRRRR